MPLTELPKEFFNSQYDIARIAAKGDKVDFLIEKAIKGMIGCIPGVGPLLQTLVFEVSEKLGSERIQKQLLDITKAQTVVDQEILKLEKKLAEAMKKPDADKFRLFFQAVAKSPYEKNREYFTTSFFKLLKEEEDAESLQRSYIRILADLNPTQCRILYHHFPYAYYSDLMDEAGEKYDIRPIDWKDQARVSKAYGVKPTVALRNIDDLIAKGLLVDDGPGRLGTKADRRFLLPTRLAVGFMEFILPSDELEAIKNEESIKAKQ